MAWKWTRPRAWNSATLAYDSCTFPAPAAFGGAGELAADRDRGPAPQFGGVRVPDDGGGVVVAVRAQRPSQGGVGVFVPLPAGQTAAMLAERGFAAGAALGGPAAGQLAAGVHGSEAGGGEGGEHARMRPHRVGDAFAAGEPGADQLVGVAPVGLGAGRADRGAAVPARGVDHPVGQGVGVQGAEDLAGGGVQVADRAAEPDGADAAAGGGGPGEPCVVVVAGGAVEQFVVEGPVRSLRSPCAGR